MTKRKQPMISPAYAAAARAAANKAAGELKTASDKARSESLDARLKARRVHSARMAEIQELVRQADLQLRQATAAAEQNLLTAENIAKGDRSAARRLRIEILDQFAATGNEAEAIEALNSLAQ